MIKAIYLVRHGQPVSGISRCLEQTDVPLDDAELYQAARLREWFADKPLKVICVSPLERCAQTARIISDVRLPIYIWPELVEMVAGLWESLFKRFASVFPKNMREAYLTFSLTTVAGWLFE